mgnify:CR=1 FL=1
MGKLSDWIKAPVSIVIGASFFSAVTTGAVDLLVSQDVEDINQRSLAPLNERIADIKARYGEQGGYQQQLAQEIDEVERMKERVADINFEIIDGPSDWNWAVFAPHDSLSIFYQSMSKFVHEQYPVTTHLSASVQNPTLVVNDDGSFLRFGSENTVDEAAANGQTLLRAAFENERRDGVSVEGTYTLKDQGVHYSPEQHNGPKQQGGQKVKPSLGS